MAKFIKCRISEVSENGNKLKNIPRGQTFEYCGQEWIVLEHDIIGEDTYENPRKEYLETKVQKLEELLDEMEKILEIRKKI